MNEKMIVIKQSCAHTFFSEHFVCFAGASFFDNTIFMVYKLNIVPKLKKRTFVYFGSIEFCAIYFIGYEKFLGFQLL